MPSFKHLFLVAGPFTCERGTLTFRTDNSHLVDDARRAKEADAEFEVTLCPPEGLKTITGRVAGIDLIAWTARPRQWEVTMVLVMERED